MQLTQHALRIALTLALGVSAANAGTINTTIGGGSNTSVLAGAVVTVDVSITFVAGDTPFSPVGSTGAGYEISFVADGGVAALGTNTVPPGYFPLPTGPCVGSSCANAVVAGNLFPSTGPVLGTHSAGSVTVDTTGLAPGVYNVLFDVSGPGDAIFASVGLDVSSEYTSVGATITVIPEPGTAALLGLGLGICGVFGRKRL